MASTSGLFQDEYVGLRVKSLRESRGLAQRDLDSPGVTYAYVSRIESGSRTPSLAALIEIAERLGTTAFFLATGKTRGECPFCRCRVEREEA